MRTCRLQLVEAWQPENFRRLLVGRQCSQNAVVQERRRAAEKSVQRL